MPAVLQRPHPLAIEGTRPDRMRALVGVRPEHDHDPVHVLSAADAGRPADRACLGRCHAPIKSRRTSRPATSDTTKESQAKPADSLKESQLAARSGPSPRRRTSPTTPSKQQASKRKRLYPGE